MKRLILTAVLSATATFGIVSALAGPPAVTKKVVLDNSRVTVTERIIPPGGERTPYTRQADQVIVFLNEATYERTDPKTGEKTIRNRKGGDVIWHDEGERAPKLVNVGSEPFGSLIIELK